MPEDPKDKSGPATLSFVRSQTRAPLPKWYLGIDLGQRFDHSAVTVLDLQWIPQGQSKVDYAYLFEPKLSMRSLERVPLGTCYEEIHEILADYLKELEKRISADTNRAAPGKELIIDAGGPGPPMVDRLRRTLRGAITLTPVIITGGKGANTLTGGYTGIPRRSIVTRLIQMISSRTLVCPPGLAGWAQFVEEMLDLSGTNTQPDGSGHDDLVIATGLAAWAAARDTKELIPGYEGPSESGGGGSGSKFGYQSRPLF